MASTLTDAEMESWTVSGPWSSMQMLGLHLTPPSPFSPPPTGPPAPASTSTSKPPSFLRQSWLVHVGVCTPVGLGVPGTRGAAGLAVLRVLVGPGVLRVLCQDVSKGRPYEPLRLQAHSLWPSVDPFTVFGAVSPD